jgi:hypothetical protein
MVRVVKGLLAVPFSAAFLDVSSDFPLIAHHIGWWDLSLAQQIKRTTVTAELRRLCRRAVDDPTVLLDPAVLKRFGCTLVEVRPDGEFFPIEVEDEQRPDGRMEVVPMYSPERSMYFTALDVLAAAVLSRRVPEIARATRYEPIGRQQIRRYLPVLPGLVLDSDVDPVLALVEFRRRAKDEGDLVLAALLRVLVNSLVFGNLCRFDEFRHKVDGRWVLDERPGPWLCLPIASCVAAGSRLLLAVLDRMVRDLGGVIAYRDTDSAVIPASPEGGTLVLLDGSSMNELTHAQIDEVVGRFDGLSPAPWWPVWKVIR